MMTRKHLRGLAEALGTRLVEAGLPARDAAAAAMAVVADLRADGLVTRAFDEDRFYAAVLDAVAVVEAGRSRVAA